MILKQRLYRPQSPILQDFVPGSTLEVSIRGLSERRSHVYCKPPQSSHCFIEVWCKWTFLLLFKWIIYLMGAKKKNYLKILSQSRWTHVQDPPLCFLAGLRQSFRLGRKNSRARDAAGSRRWSTGVNQPVPPATYREVIPQQRDPSDKERLVVLVGTYEQKHAAEGRMVCVPGCCQILWNRNESIWTVE